MTEERKLVTVLFADIVGSTALAGEHDPELLRAALDRTFDRIAPVVAEHGGTVEKFIGDAVMAVFGVPASHDDDAERAIRAAFRIREAVRGAGGRIAFDVRIGVNTGEAVARTDSADQRLVTGIAVNQAQRLQAAAEPGEIVAGELTERLTRAAVRYGDRREVQAKGIGALTAHPALELRDALPEQHRGIAGLRAPLIGRDEELGLLLGGYERMRTEGRPYLVTVFGSAGAGKSRLTEEFLARIAGARIRQGRCPPYGEGITLWPVQMILRADAEIAPSDDLAAARQRLTDAVTAAFPENADDRDAVLRRLEVLAGTGSADVLLPEVAAAELSEELAWGLRRYLERRAASEPLILVFEDIHWAAGPLLELVEHLAEWAKAPLLLLCLARPEFLDARPGWGGGKVNAASVVLEPLTPEETRDLVARLLDLDALTEEVRASVVERAEGNPLYVEEFIRLLIETGQIAHRDGRWVAVAAGALQVPPTLQGLISARLDTAPPPVKRLLQRAAVIGRFFPTTGVAALGDGPPTAAELRDAVRRDLLVDVDERGVGGGRVYRFKHVLIRDVAYGTLPKTERARLHDRYVRWYEETLGDRREDFIDLIAYHADQSFGFASEMALPEVPELARRAWERLMAAATKARTRGDLSAALTLYRQAEAAAPDASLTPLERLDVDARLALGRHATEATPEALAGVQAALARARALGATKQILELLGASWFHLPALERQAALDELRTLALASDDPADVVKGLWYRITETSPLDDDLRYLDEALEHATRHGLTDQAVQCLALMTGRLRQQLRYSDAERRLSDWERLLGGAPTRAQRAALLQERAWDLTERADPAAALPHWDELGALQRDRGDLRGAIIAMSNKSWALWLLGRVEEALALNGEQLAALEGKTARFIHVIAWGRQAEYLLSRGRTADARAQLEEARAAWPEQWALPFAQRALALVLAAEGEPAQALDVLAATRAKLEREGAEFPELTFSYARILLQAGRAANARRLLEAFRAKLTDPLAGRLRQTADALLAECATPA